MTLMLVAVLPPVYRKMLDEGRSDACTRSRDES
jgi:hypothetical protein